MKRLGVSGAVRPIYGSLGVKRLRKSYIRNTTIEVTVALVRSVYLPYECTLKPIYVHATSLG